MRKEVGRGKVLGCHEDTQTLNYADLSSPVYNHIFQYELPIPPTKVKSYTYRNESTGNEIDFYDLDVKTFEQQIYPDLEPAQLAGYDGISPGPTFRITKGRESIVRVKNHSGKDISVHLHGAHSRAPFDGWAEDITEPGQYKDYYWPNKGSGQTIWYHDHAAGSTAVNNHLGQSGFYIIEDPAERALNLPSNEYDVPLALSSKQYNKDGTLFDPKDEDFGLPGDIIQVNGQPWPFMKVEPRKYRFRLLNTAISRSFKLSLEDEEERNVSFKVIAADSGLLAKPVETSDLELSMAERWEVIVDFTKYAGQNVTMKNARSVQADPDYHSTDKVMRFVVGWGITYVNGNGDVPNTLRTVPYPPPKTSIDRRFKFEREDGIWLINGVSFADVNNRILAKPQRGAVEVWEFENEAGPWSHPIHMHLVDFKILSRTGGNGRGVLPYEKEAMKDVVLLGENEKVTVLARYAPYEGVYMFHCHDFIHEDHDMMAAFNVTGLSGWGYPEKTRLEDPMDKKYRARMISEKDDSEESVMAKCAEFAALEAYTEPDRMEKSLDEYWGRRAGGGRGGREDKEEGESRGVREQGTSGVKAKAVEAESSSAKIRRWAAWQLLALVVFFALFM
ncbi:blue copper oxidase cueO precursor [Stemphylium lycopersici]|nr:bilirubin oxidase [Stemphylium lycopersici]RAR08607.1 blue copper oxidase cueO precursor [Stemphylium lycopersici]